MVVLENQVHTHKKNRNIFVLITIVVIVIVAVTLQFVSHSFLDYHDPTIGEWRYFVYMVFIIKKCSL